jgi:hypothetical protein
MSGTHILPCRVCKSGPAADFQNRKYGKDRRVHNSNGKGASCTVCGNRVLNNDLSFAKPKKGGGGGGGAKRLIAIPPPEGWPGGADYGKNGWKQL